MPTASTCPQVSGFPASATISHHRTRTVELSQRARNSRRFTRRAQFPAPATRIYRPARPGAPRLPHATPTSDPPPRPRGHNFPRLGRETTDRHGQQDTFVANANGTALASLANARENPPRTRSTRKTPLKIKNTSLRISGLEFDSSASPLRVLRRIATARLPHRH